MRPAVDLLQLFNAVMRVNLRRRQACMPQQLLYCIEFCAVIGKMCGKTMPEHVRTFLLLRSDLRQVTFNRSVHILRIQLPA